MEGFRSVMRLIQSFLGALPPDVLMIAMFAFIGFCVLGFLRWFK